MNILLESDKENGRRFSLDAETKECPTCKGTGISEELDHDGECVSMTMYRDIDCPECKGRGYVIVEEEKT